MAYASVEQAQADLFTCARRSLVLTRQGCATLFAGANRRGNRPQPWEGRAACVQCPVGARHAGVVLIRQPGNHPDLGTVCPRCNNPERRLIWNRLCASCDARAGEAKRGRNGKGTRPGLLDRLTVRTIRVQSTQAASLHRLTVVSLTEALVATARATTVPLIIGRPGIERPTMPGMQTEMWLPMPAISFGG